ncbi:MAG: hypothetical protein J7497_13240, partial [Chitinophagaceae bacterium]|nr:hypothetical protein [Chitinophagaceae bacterium]
MKNYFVVLLLVSLFSCNEKNGPDVSKIEVKLVTERFEKDFFAVDTNNLSPSLDALYNKYPGFFGDFTQQILGLPPLNDSGAQAMIAIKQFIHDYRPVYDSANKIIDLSRYEDEIIDGLKHVKYYFPSYHLPEKLISFIGPINGYGDVITPDGLAIGLQHHLGADFSMYNSEMGLSLYPKYISRRFSPEYIPVNCIKNIIDDIYPDESVDKTLVEQMIEKGKRMYVLDKLMPDTPDTLKIGYTDMQLKGCYTNEGRIWNYFVKNGYVYNNDPSIIKNYIGESPNTPEFGDGAPGNIGLFVGWQIVKKYMSDNPSGSLTDLMQLDPKKLFENSRYRPR